MAKDISSKQKVCKGYCKLLKIEVEIAGICLLMNKYEHTTRN